MSDVLLTLFQAGWEPMTPLDMGLHLQESAKSGPQVTICFKQKEELSTDSSIDLSRVSLDPLSEHSCLCLETYGSNYLGFHNLSNTTLHEIVTSLTSEWPPGLVGVSGGVSSVISDYMAPSTTPATLPADPSLPNQKYIQLAGEPWSSEDVRLTNRLQMCLIACLLKVRQSKWRKCQADKMFRRAINSAWMSTLTHPVEFSSSLKRLRTRLARFWCRTWRASASTRRTGPWCSGPSPPSSGRTRARGGCH